MNRLLLTFCFILFFYCSSGFSQTNGNIPLSFKSRFDRFWGVGDVWGVQINGINYALATLDGGLSIINTNNPSSPSEKVHINKTGYSRSNSSFSVRLNVPDVETYTKNGITYAYLATNNTQDPNMPLVIIINVNEAINNAPPLPNNEILIDPYNPSGSVYVGKINDLSNVVQSHTLTIEDGYLYVASINQYMPIWYLGNNPTSPTYVTTLTNNTPNAKLHELNVHSHNPNTATVLASFVRGGLKTYNIVYNPQGKGGISANVINSTVHLYDFDRTYPNKYDSDDPNFDYRVTHSAWFSDDEQYIFTTDEIAVDLDTLAPPYSPDDPNLYSTGVLKSPRRQGAFLRVWDAFRLGQSNSFMGSYYVSEESPWGITNMTEIDTNWVPNSIHQMYVSGNYMYLAHYTQGFRMLDISDPENIIELGLYDDHPTINFNLNSEYYFRKFKGRWYHGIYGVFPDPNRSNICYAGGYPGGFYIFDVAVPPFSPSNLSVAANPQNNYVLSWTPSTSQNIQNYRIYRADVPNDPPYNLPFYIEIDAYEEGNPVTSWEDINSYPGQGGGNYYYAISVKNSGGYESLQSNRVNVPKGGIDKISEEGGKTNLEVFEYSLSDNYPNPFNPTTQINFSIQKAGMVTIKVYDLLGNEVANLVNERKEPGNYSVNFKAENLPSGVYVYKLTSGNYVATKKLLLLK